MSKSIKLSGNVYIDSSGIIHNRTLLNTVLNGINSSIGSINSSITSINNEISNLKKVTTGSLTITKTSGSANATGTYAKYGNVVAYDITLSTTASTASGGDLFVGTISNFTPKINTILVGYFGVRPIIANFTTEKKITVRNASASSLGSGSSPSIRGTFIV